LTLTVFQYAYVFNADLSKWNTTAVTKMTQSTSTPVLWFFPFLGSMSFVFSIFSNFFSSVFFFSRNFFKKCQN
jgi:surface protein